MGVIDWQRVLQIREMSSRLAKKTEGGLRNGIGNSIEKEED